MAGFPASLHGLTLESQPPKQLPLHQGLDVESPPPPPPPPKQLPLPHWPLPRKHSLALAKTGDEEQLAHCSEAQLGGCLEAELGDEEQLGDEERLHRQEHLAKAGHEEEQVSEEE